MIYITVMIYLYMTKIKKLVRVIIFLLEKRLLIIGIITMMTMMEK